MKNKIIIYVSVLLTFILCHLVTGCSTSKEDISTDSFLFCVQRPQSIDVETKAELINGSERTEISNAWIVQYTADSNNLLHCVYTESGFNEINNGYMVEIKPIDNDFTVTASDFYIILNGGSELLKNFKEEIDHSRAALARKICPRPTDIITRPSLLTAGPASYTESTEVTKIVFVSRVYRAFAKFSLNVKFPTSKDIFVVSDATVTNIPKSMALYTGNNASYPDINDIETTPIKLAGVSTSGTASFYMPENIRGTGASLTFQGKNVASNGPGGNLDGCTYLTLKGKYYYDKTQSGGSYVQDPIDVEYRFYLGSNLTNDYNIRRDHHYNLTINLKGANSADLRVTITNGNVAVFDEVETIENKVDF